MAVIKASVDISAGNFDSALQRYTSLTAQLAKLHDNHPCRAMLHSCVGAALYHQGHLQPAFEHLVQVCSQPWFEMMCGHEGV